MPKQQKKYQVGEVVFFKRPTHLHVRGYGIRMFLATQGSESITKEEDRALVKRENVPEDGFGMVVGCCFEPLHGAGTTYYKVLLNETLYWIGSAFLSR